MTTPKPPNPFASVTPQDEEDALHGISQMLTGTKVLKDEPGVVYALQQQQAPAQDAQAIDQFMQGLDAQRQVRLAEATGQKITLTTAQKAQLDALHMDYSTVEFTRIDAETAAAQRITTESNGQLRAKQDAGGNYVVDKHGNLVTESTNPTADPADHGYGTGFLGLGPLFHTLKNDVVDPIGRDVVDPAVTVLSKGYNAVQSFGADERQQNMAGFEGKSYQDVVDASVSRSADAQTQGYDPSNPFSMLAFSASGKAHTDLTPLAQSWDSKHPNGLFSWNGSQAVAEATKFIDSPDSYTKALENDPTNYAADGSMTPTGAAKLQAINSPDFQALTREVQAHSATVGNDIANAIGIDPVAHPSYYALTAAGTNLAAAFAIDPLIIAGSVAKAAKLSQVGLDSLSDTNGAIRALDPASSGIYAANARRGWQRAIDLSGQIRDAHAAEDTVQVAALTSKFNASLPALAPILPDFVGTNMIKGFDAVTGEPIIGAGDGIRSLEDASNYIASKWAMTRLMNGRAATQSSLMPGALSIFGYRKLKGAVAGWMTSRSGARAEKAYASAVDQLKADPEKMTKWLDDGLLVKFEPQADDAIDSTTDNVIAHKGFLDLRSDVRAALSGAAVTRGKDAVAETKQLNAELDDLEARLQELSADKTTPTETLAALHDQIQTGRDLIAMHTKSSALDVESYQTLTNVERQMSADENAAQAGSQAGNLPAYKAGEGAPLNRELAPDVSYALTYAGKGEVVRNLRQTGSATGGGLGWASPTAIASRSRLAAQRFTTLLPRNTMIDINDSASADKIYKLALTYLNRGDANALKAAWNLGDGGQRKAIISGIIDQLGHAAGLGKTKTGQTILDQAKTAVEDYSSVGDNVVLDGQSLALHAGQVRTTWVLPTFQAMQQASRRIGLWEATMGRALTGPMADLLMSQWKLGALFKPSTVTRNQLEGWLRTSLEGKFGDAVKAKAVLTTSNRELWESDSEAVRKIASESKAEYDRLLVDGKTKEAEQLARGNMLSGEILGRSVTTTNLAKLWPIAATGRAYRLLLGKSMDVEHVEALLTLGKDELAQAMEEYGQQIREADLGTRRAAREAGEIAKAGWGPARIARSINLAARKGDKAPGQKVSWTQQDVDGTVGADRYENALAQRVNATPSVARAVIDHLRDPQAHTVDSVIEALDDPAIASKMRLTGWGRVAWDEPTGPARLATNDAEQLLGKRDWANKVINDYRHLLTGQNREFQNKLADEIHLTGRAPNADWITTNLKGHNRPESVLAPEVMAMPNGGMRNGIQAFQDIEGGAYQWMVERPLQRTTSSPVFMANYADARVGLNKFVEDMVANHGVSRTAAEYQARELAIKQAWIKTEQLIDDPGQKAQFDIVARNMFPFSRATQAMIRRWGTGLWQNPVAARKMMLAYEGAQHTGFIYNNAYGEPTFTYPASGVLNMAMRELAKVPGFENLNQFPISSSMTGGVLMSVPGADNPFRMSMGPMLSIPMREVFNLFPDHRAMLDEVDSFINGPIGVGETISQLAPALGRKFYTALDTDDRNSAMASAMTGAIANLAAAGLVPPADASPSVRDAFLQNLRAQVRSQLFLRAIFGLFAPAAPSTPSEGTTGSHSDYAFQMQGLGQLSDEYKTILNDVDGNSARANAIWSALHPDKMVYEVSKSRATTSNVYLPATSRALDWMEKNTSFINGYKSVAAYFMPELASNEAFNDRAYNTQIELGLRQRKTPTEFYTEIRVRNAEAQYYPIVDQFNQKIAEAQKEGQTALANQYARAKSGWERNFKALNPLFQQKIDSYPDARSMALGQLADLKRMLSEGQVPDGQAALLGQLITNYDNYDAFTHQNNGQDDRSIAIRHAALQMFNDWVSKHVTGTSLADLYAGVFRTLNTNLANLNTLTP